MVQRRSWQCLEMGGRGPGKVFSPVGKDSYPIGLIAVCVLQEKSPLLQVHVGSFQALLCSFVSRPAAREEQQGPRRIPTHTSQAGPRRLT